MVTKIMWKSYLRFILKCLEVGRGRRKSFLQEKNHEQRFIGRKEQVTQRIMRSSEMNSNKHRKMCGCIVQNPGTLSTEA